MRFEVLGPFRIVDAGVEIPLRGRTQRRVLAAMLTRAGGQMSLSELVDALWPQDPPVNAVKNVQSYVAKLKHVLGDPNLIGSGPGGYRLILGRRDLDAREFTEAVRRAHQAQATGDLATAGSVLDRALRLWRGRPYADMADWAFLHAEIERLEQLRLEALGVALDLGQHARVLPELTALVDQNPYQEHAVALLMQALYAVGRQAEAQELYRTTRNQLAEELGTNPTPELREQYQSLLQDDRLGSTRPAGPNREQVDEEMRVDDVSEPTPSGEPESRPIATVSSRVVLVDGMPRPPRALQERTEQLAALQRLGERNEPALVCSVTGARGVGKTQLAASYARLRLTQGWNVIWLDAESRERLLAGLGSLAEVLDPRHAGDAIEYAAMRARRWLSEGETPTLLVLDNATEPDLIRQWLPAAGSVQVIVTSNRRVFAWLGEHVEVDVFTPAQAHTFLHDCSGGLINDGTDQLTEAVGGHALALTLAAAVITREHLTCHDYLRRLAALPVDAALAPHEGDPYPRSMGEAIRLSLDTVSQQAPETRDLAELIAVLSPAGAPRSLLVPDDAPEDTKALRSRIIGLLADVSLTTYSQDGQAVIMHRLTRRVVAERAARDGRMNAAVAQGTALLGARLRTTEPDYDLAAHLEALLELADTPDLHRDRLAELLELGEQIVSSSWYRGKRDIARSVNKALLPQQERALGPHHPATLRSRSVLAWAHRASGRVDDALVLGEETLAEQERTLGAGHVDSLKTRSELANTYTAAGRPHQAVPLLEQTIEGQKRALGISHLDTILSRISLAWTHQSLGALEVALELQRDVIAKCERSGVFPLFWTPS